LSGITGGETTSGSPSQSDQQNLFTPSVNSPQFLLIILLVLILIFIRRVLGIFRWFFEKSIGGFIFIIGAFYNVQDRYLDHNDVLLNQTRAKIMAYLEHIGRTGAHLREIKSTLQIGTGALLWHLQVLEDFGWLEQYKISRYSIFVASEYAHTFDPNQKELEMKLQSKHTHKIVETLTRIDHQDGINISELSSTTSIDRKTVRRIVKVLERYGSLELEKGKETRIFVLNSQPLEKILDSIEQRDSFDHQVSAIDVQFLE
jgi:predicted transcriptional regulator